MVCRFFLDQKTTARLPEALLCFLFDLHAIFLCLRDYSKVLLMPLAMLLLKLADMRFKFILGLLMLNG